MSRLLPRRARHLLRTLIVLGCFAAPCSAQETPADNKPAEPELAAGHSMHGETFNEGPRQAAYLMEGMGQIHFPVATSKPLAQKFFNQGVAQLHGFWYYEAERSFRQAAVHDPDCAMSYWGMALANVNNVKRARGFIAEAVKRKENASAREKMFIESADLRFKETKDGKPSKKEVAERYSRDLEDIVLAYPEDIEAKALLALQLWENERNDSPIVSHVAINSVLDELFALAPMHPAHHYRIHLWDRRKPAQALKSAALCGPSLPGIAHMWHMPGHTYSNVQRYSDAVWQQEASARVDHAHMMRDKVMPDQIHNYAHNNEWTIRNLLKIGRVSDALSLSKNMIELPRHPKFNTLKGGSARFGRERLMLTLTTYRLWDETLALADTMYLETTDDVEQQVERLRLIGIAASFLGRDDKTNSVVEDLESRLKKVEEELAANQEPKPEETKPEEKKEGPKPDAVATADAKPATETKVAEKAAGEEKPVAEAAKTEPAAKACDEASEKNAVEKKDGEKTDDEKKAEENRKRREKERADARKKLEPQQKQLKAALAAIAAVKASKAGNWNEAIEKFDQAGNWDKSLKAEWLAEAGKGEEAVKLCDGEISGKKNEILPHAEAAFVHWKLGEKDKARAEFDKTRDLSSEAEIGTPLLARLADMAREFAYPADWKKPYERPADIGQRPSLDSLGPFRYGPYAAPQWQAQERGGEAVESSRFAGKPTIVIFYLGFGCLHCVEQLKEFSPAVEEFRAAGIELVGISNETPELLGKGMDAYDKPLNFPLFADGEMKAFKTYRCFDDFEQKPLHGTFLIDAQGQVLWQDISYEPFKDVKFLQAEAKRLLSLRQEPVKQ